MTVVCLLFTLLLTSAPAFTLRVRAGSKPTLEMVTLIGTAFKEFHSHPEVAAVNVHAMIDINSSIVVADIVTYDGDETDVWGRGYTVQQACEEACKFGIRALEVRKDVDTY